MLNRPKKTCRTIGFWNYHEDLNKNNFMFEYPNAVNGDNLLLPIVELGKHLNERNIKAASLDVLDSEEVDSYIFLDIPDKKNTHFQTAVRSGKPIYLLILESPLVRPENYDQERHTQFKKIFTYNDSQVDGDKYIKINYAFSLDKVTRVSTANKEKLCVMIASNKNIRKIKHGDELYTERLNAIKWFERHHKTEFDLYGFGWNPSHKQAKTLNPIKAFKRMISPSFECYRGVVERKRPILEKYKFAICYENMRNVAGYITEKIFDCFFAGCVPVYLGADNVADYIPSGCFIDRRNFDNYEDLYTYMTGMSNDEYEKYLDNINIFLKSEAAFLFSIDSFINTINSELL